MALTKAERNDAITKLYREGWTQKGIAEKFRIDKGQISRVIGAKERSAKVVSHNNAIKSELTPAHEQVIRTAPKPLQDKIAEVVLTREDSTPEST